MQQFQEAEHADNHDYREGSPHLKHWHLYDRLVFLLREVLRCSEATGAGQHLLDVGAGAGSFIEPALSSGFRVTALEMSRPSLARLEQRFGMNPNLALGFDPDGSLSPIQGQRFSVILYAAVLHHIPNYIGAVENAVTNHLRQGGSFVSFQDPLWYPSVPTRTRRVSQIAYFWWRLTQGNLKRGLQTRIRRMRGIFDEANPADMAEYHVVRKGVDHERLVGVLSTHFEDVNLIPYWSTQSGIWQRVGERMGLKNTFAIVATNFRSSDR